MLQFVVFAVTIIIVLVAAVIFLLPGSKKITTIPGPDPVDFLEGNFPDIQAAGSLHEFLVELHQTYGPIASLWWGPRLTVSIASPELFKEQSKVFDRPGCIYEQFKPLLGEDSILFTNGLEGRKRHTAYSKCYSSTVIAQYYTLSNKLSKELIAKWSAVPANDHIPLRRYMFAFSIKTVLQASFGSYFNDDKTIYKLRQAYDFVWSEMENRLLGGITEASRESLDRFDQQKEVLMKIVREALDYRKSHGSHDGEHLFIDALLEQDDYDIQMSDAITGFVGGFHTTGLVLTWALYFLASHQDVQDQLFEELNMVLGDKDVEPENYNDLKYLHQIIDETLRCSVLSPFAARVQDVDTELGGHRVPAGTPVIQAVGVVLKDPEIYPDPDRFDPDRFSDEMKKTRPSLSFEPFGFAGKRICPGYQFALAESAVLLAAIIRSFKVKLIDDQVVVPEHGLLTKPKEEIWITLSKRK